MARVSKQFNQLVGDPEAHKRVSLTGFLELEKVSGFLSNKPNVEKFCLDGIPEKLWGKSPVYEQFQSVFSKMKRLGHVEVGRPWYLDVKLLEVLLQDPEKAKRLTHLIVNVAHNDNQEKKNYHPTSIKHLELNYHPPLNFFLSIALSSTKLERLKSDEWLPFQPERLRPVFQQSAQTLKEVNLPSYL